MNELLLRPTPRHLLLTGGEVLLAELPLWEHLDGRGVTEAGPEAYRLEIAADGIRLSARTEVGLRHARATLAQVRRYARVPCLVIDDAPRFAQRGVMLDISRDRVPTMTTLFALVDRLAAWKMNHLQLYVEHTIAYAGHDPVWQAASPLSLEEISALDAYARRVGISLHANQNCLGHFERWLRHPRYAPLGEVDRGQMVGGVFHVPPNTLCPGDAGTLPLITDLLRQLVPRCSGEFVNIGCDEPWDLGKGRSREDCDRLGRGAVFSAHVKRVCEVVHGLGKRPQFWCDPHPNEGQGLPQDVVALVWGYGAETDFCTRIAAHRQVGREAWVAPGTNCWNSATGRTWMRRANLDRAAATDADGFLCTAWGDGGHRQQWPITLFGFADAAQAAWYGPGLYDDRAAGWHAFGCAEVGPWLARLGNLDGELCRGERPNWNRPPGGHVHAHWNELQTNLFEPAGTGDLAAWVEIGNRLSALPELPAELSPLVAQECRHARQVMGWIVERALARRRGLSEDVRKRLAADMTGVVAEHRRLWLERSRPGGLNDSCAHYERHSIAW